MSGSSFGRLFRVTTAGESHGPAIVAIVEGCPPGLPLDEADLAVELRRRRPGQSRLTTPRREDDSPRILSGVYEGRTTGTPIAVLVPSSGQRSKDYEPLADLYRPGHADWSYEARYGRRDPRGGGRASARETVARVAAGAIARKLLAERLGVEIVGYVVQVGSERARIDSETVQRTQVERLPDGSPNPVRCPDPEAAGRMAALVEQVRAEGDSVGGVCEVVARGVPAGLGDPVFEKLEAEIGRALLSVPAVVGFEVGDGFAAAARRGSEHHDAFVPGEAGGARVRAETNRHGGILGGISTGMPIVVRAALKPPSSIRRPQRTVDREGRPRTVRVAGRHDPCVLPRFVPIAEAMVALVLADQYLRWLAVRGEAPGAGCPEGPDSGRSAQ